MTRSRQGVTLAIAKWVFGIVAAVLGSVLTFVIISEISEENGPPLPTESPSTSLPSPPPWHGTLNDAQLTSALLGSSDLPPGSGYGNGAIGTARVYQVCHNADAEATVLGDSGRRAGPVGVSYTRSGDNLHKDRIISVREDLASYASEKDATNAMTRFRTWIDRCRDSTSTGPFGENRVHVTGLSFDNHGDTTLAATAWYRYPNLCLTTFPGCVGGQHSQHEIVVVVQLRRTVCVFRIASAPTAVAKDGTSQPPAVADVSGYIATAVDKLKAIE